MPVISMFYGIIIAMYFLDRKQHHKPHIHAKYQDQEAVIGIPDGVLIDGSLPPPKLKLVQAWIEIHREDLLADWALASQGETVFKVEPLR